MKQIRFLTVMTCCFFLYSFVNAKEKNSETKLQGLPVIDLTKNYPEKEFVADDVDKEYIPLETTNEVLAEAAFRIDYVSDKRIVGTNLTRGDENSQMIGIYNTSTMKFGQEFVIADRSCDTVFLLKQDKKLTPLFVRTPSCFNENKLVTMGIDFKTDKFLFFGSLTYNWSEIIAQVKRGQQISLPPGKDFAYNIQTGEIFTVTRGPSSMGDAPKNTAVRRIRADRLVKDLKDGKLKGKLEQVAKSVNEDDNPVIEITKFR